MSDVKAVNAIHMDVRNDLQRRRELSALTKPELISKLIAMQDKINDTFAQLAAIDAAYGDEP